MGLQVQIFHAERRVSPRTLARDRTGASARVGRQGSMKLAWSAPASSYALEFPGRQDRCIGRLWVRDDHSNGG